MTARELELICNARSSKSNINLFEAINFTTTVVGERLLRSELLQPQFGSCSRIFCKLDFCRGILVCLAHF
jgi:hypothetical protein